MNDKSTVKPNIIFETTVHKDPIEGYPSLVITSLQCFAQSGENLRQCPIDMDFRLAP
jgi:hypothetical protein